ncbi:MAG TPA: hypothetical protein VHP83_20570 [Aggregatilineaceae bacterium]|nr:hypothetical protein [Aggregatilineaceae bacterium]
MITCECKKCSTSFKHNSGSIRCPNCGSHQVWIVGGIGNVMVITVLLASVMALVGFFLLPPDTFLAEVVALSVAVPIVGIRFWLWRKPHA